MTGAVKVYLDACTLIYLAEGTGELVDVVLAHVSAEPVRFVTSRLSLLECRVGPLRSGDAALLAHYDDMFAAVDLDVVEIDAAVIERATQLRVGYGVRTPDAIHLASAIVHGVDSFLTGDADLQRVTELAVQVIRIDEKSVADDGG